MNKFLFVILILTAGTGSALSQPFSKIYFGVQGGYNISSYSISYDGGLTGTGSPGSSDSYGRFNGGIFIESAIYREFGLRLESEFIHKGGVINSNIISSTGLTSIDRVYESQLQYLGFNLLPYYYKDLSEGIGPVLYAGGYLSFLTRAKEFTTQKTFPPYVQEMKTERDIKNFLSGVDAGLIFGGAVNIRNFSAGARYYLGLTNIIDDSKADVSAEAKNRIISFIISFKF